MEQFEQSLRMAQGEFLPSLSAGGNWGYYDRGGLDLQDEEWSVQVQMSVPLFEGGRRLAMINRTRNQLQAERMRFEEAVQSVHGLIEDSVLLLREEIENYAAASAAEDVARQHYQDVFNFYEEGLSQSLDLTQALTDLVAARTDVIFARYNYLRVFVQLHAALGTLPTHRNGYVTSSWISIPLEGSMTRISTGKSPETVIPPDQD